MKKLIVPLAGLAALHLALPLAQAQDEVKAIVEKAIKAHGGEAYTKKSAGEGKNKGTLEIMGLNIPFTQEMYWHAPMKFKEAVHLDIMGQKIDVITVYDGKTGWLSQNGQVMEMPKELMDEIKEAGYLMSLSRMNLLENKDITLSPVGEIQVDGKPAVGIKISSKGHRDVNMYYDKNTGLLAKSERQALDPMSGQEVREERMIQEYQTVGGAKLPKRILIHRDGKKFLELEVLEIKLLDSIDDGHFAKP